MCVSLKIFYLFHKFQIVLYSKLNTTANLIKLSEDVSKEKTSHKKTSIEHLKLYERNEEK